MGRTRDQITLATSPGAWPLRFAFPANDTSVRRALYAITGALGRTGVDPRFPGVVEIVLAEVLNNVVEHAFSDGKRGFFEVSVDCIGDSLVFCITDDGRPMPGSGLPKGRRHDLSVATADLPEGGFGWFLIHELTQDLSYVRLEDRNTLRFRISTDAITRPN